MLSVVLLGMVGGLIYLASETSVPQVTRAPGKVVPLGEHTQIETMEGGIVDVVHVSEGNEGDAFPNFLGECDRSCKVRVAVVTTSTNIPPVLTTDDIRLVA